MSQEQHYTLFSTELERLVNQVLQVGESQKIPPHVFVFILKEAQQYLINRFQIEDMKVEFKPARQASPTNLQLVEK